MIAAIAAVRPIRPAAVLVPIIERDEPSVLLTQRTAHLADHAGQISFPGGKIDAGDESPAAAALREAEEEIALPRRFVEPLGYLDIHITPWGHRIVPMVARVQPGFALRLNRDEVDDAFEVPLAFLMTPQSYKRESRDWNGLTLSYYVMPFGDQKNLGRDRVYTSKLVRTGISSMTMHRAVTMSAYGPKQTSLVAPHMSAFRGKADMTVCGNPLSRSLLGAKRTCPFALHMSANDPKRTLAVRSVRFTRREYPCGIQSCRGHDKAHDQHKSCGQIWEPSRYSIKAGPCF